MKRLLRPSLLLVLAAAFAFAAIAPPERCPSVRADDLRASAQASVDWFVRNQDPDGTWLYLYDAEDDSIAAEYNAIRHSGVTMGLYQAAEAGLPGALRSADRGTEWAVDNLIARDRWAAVEYLSEVSTGASALLAAGLTYRRETTGETRYDPLMRRLGRFLIAQTEPTGAVLAYYDLGTGEPIPGAYSKYYTGEAYWALARLHLAFPGEGWDAAADRIGSYLASERDDVENYWPPIPDHWAAYGQAETVEFPERAGRLTEAEVDYARQQAGYFGSATRWVSQQFGPWGELVRPGDKPRGGGYGVMSEALTAWWIVARSEPRLSGLEAPIAERAECVAGLAIREQADAEDAAAAATPERVEGAWLINGETRMDDQQHALAGLLRTIPIVEASATSDPLDSSDSEDDAPSGWLWALALVLAMNPARAAFAIPRAGRSANEPLRLAVLGGLAGVAGLLAVAALADPLLDALDVSDPSFRTAAGLVAVIAGAADLFRRPPPPEPSLAGWRAALVPVAVPVVARPALVVMALAAGADKSLLVTAGALALAIAVLAGVTAAAPTDGPPGRALRWAGRLLGAGLVACGVVLTLDGILDV